MFAWRRRLRQEAFKPVEAVPARRREHSESAVELRLPRGGHLIVRPGFDRQLLLEVIDALERTSRKARS